MPFCTPPPPDTTPAIVQTVPAPADVVKGRVLVVKPMTSSHGNHPDQTVAAVECEGMGGSTYHIRVLVGEAHTNSNQWLQIFNGNVTLTGTSPMKVHIGGGEVSWTLSISFTKPSTAPIFFSLMGPNGEVIPVE